MIDENKKKAGLPGIKVMGLFYFLRAKGNIVLVMPYYDAQ
jgi:hypothetical protein